MVLVRDVKPVWLACVLKHTPGAHFFQLIAVPLENNYEFEFLDLEFVFLKT